MRAGPRHVKCDEITFRYNFVNSDVEIGEGLS